jgi:serine/threonine protein kinase SCH9
MKGYTKLVDFWSLGVLVFEMCCGWSPFYADDTQQMYKNIAFGKVRFPKDTLSAEGKSFVKGVSSLNYWTYDSFSIATQNTDLVRKMMHES